ncbi:MAG TPA: hypothetical protein VGL81_17780 [Polyangiaceae bacterium]|jgi:hypothetical protein
MSESKSPLDARDVALLREARDAGPPAPEVVERVRVRLAALAPPTVSQGGGAGSETGRAVARLAGSKAAIAVTSLLLGGAAGAGIYAELRPPQQAQVVYIPQPMAASVASVVPAPSSAAPSEVVAGTSTASTARTAASPGPSTSSRTLQLSAERILLDEARGALVQGNPSRALERIEQHRRTFATPILGEERDAMEVEALAKVGRSAEARAKADAFRRHTPNSLFLPAVQSAVESIP